MAGILSQHWESIQATLFPFLKEEIGVITPKHEALIVVLDFARVEVFISNFYGCVGRPLEDRCSLARAFFAKVVYNLPTTRALIDRLQCDVVTRRLCGWERRGDIPSEATFSRAFAEFSKNNLPERIQNAVIQCYHSERIIGHISRDATTIEAREKAAIKSKRKESGTPGKKKRGRPYKGEVRPLPGPTRLERQLGMDLEEMLADLPKACDIGVKKNSKGFTETWKGYKLHIDTADGDIPISQILTSASPHDSQVALPLSIQTGQKLKYVFYEVMDAAYDSHIIREYITSKDHVPLIDYNHRGPKDERAFYPHEAARYKERSAAERTNSNLKDNFGGRFIRVRGHAKVFTHLMFGLLAITILQTVKIIT